MSIRKRWIAIIIALLLVGAISLFVASEQANAPASDGGNTEQLEADETQTTETGLDKTKYSIDEPGSLWWIVSRERPLPDGYEPSNLEVPDTQLRLAATAEQMQLRGTVATATEAMFAAAQSDGIELVFGSGYRSESLQAQFYNSYVARDGQEAADRYSAHPGTSEHQTGLAFDVTSLSGACHLEICFEDLPEGQWVQDNAHDYGFIIRYLDGKENITGYQYEPWHLRYVGEELANELHENGQTMEEFFGLTGTAD